MVEFSLPGRQAPGFESIGILIPLCRMMAHDCSSTGRADPAKLRKAVAWGVRSETVTSAEVGIGLPPRLGSGRVARQARGQQGSRSGVRDRLKVVIRDSRPAGIRLRSCRAGPTAASQGESL